jgi:hypothetical protein
MHEFGQYYTAIDRALFSASAYGSKRSAKAYDPEIGHFR